MAITHLFRAAALAAVIALFVSIQPAAAVVEGDDLSVVDATVTYVLHFELVAMREFRKAPHGSNTQSRLAVMGYLLPGDAPEEILTLMQDNAGGLLIHQAAIDGGIEMNGKWVPLTPDHCYDIPTRVHYNAESRPDDIRMLDVLDVTDTKDHSKYKELLEEQEGSSDPEA